MNLTFSNGFRWRGLLPDLWTQWENTTLTVVVSIDGPIETSTPALQLVADFEVGERVERWLLPRYERWAEEKEWVT